MTINNGGRWLRFSLTILTLAGAMVAIASSVSSAASCRPPFRATDLSLSGSVEPAAPNVNYTLVVTNNGPNCTGGVTTTTQLAPGSTFVGLVRSDPGSWSCSGSTVVTCRLLATIPAPPGQNTASVTFAATAPSSPDDATVHASVTSASTDPFPSNNELWQAFGKSASAGQVSDKHPKAGLTRPDSQSIAVNLLDIGVFPPAPPGYSFQTDRAILVATPPAPGQSKGQALALVITFRSQSSPGPFVFHLNHETNVWEVVMQQCGDNGPFPCIDNVSYSGGGIATITVLTLHFSHFSK